MIVNKVMINMLKDKVVIITGASSGIGAATAIRLAKEGAIIVIASRNIKGLDTVAEAIRKIKGQVMSIKVDIKNEGDIKDMISIVKNKFGMIDAIINNAGVFYTGNIDEFDTNELDETLDINLRGLYLCCKYAAQAMKKQKKGHIINISSGAGRQGRADRSAYAASKFGVIGITEAISEELKPYNVKVTAICPGPVNTPMHYKRKSKSELAKMLNPEEVAELIAYTLSLGDNANITEVHLRPMQY